METEADKVEPVDSEPDEEEDVYEVERIIDMRVEEGEVLYRVRWKNYCSDDDTWEPEAHLEDCREVLLAFKKSMADAKAKKEAEAKKSVKLLPTKSDVFDADSESDGDKDHPTEAPLKKKKKTKIREEEPPPKEKKKKKKDKRKEDFRPLPAPETDEEEEEEEERPPTPASSPKEKKTESKKRVVDTDEEEDEPVPSKKHKKEKGKEGGKHRKEKGEEGKKKKGKKERKIETSEDEAAAPLEDDLSDGPSESQVDGIVLTDAAANLVDKAQLDDKFKKKGKWEVKLQGIKDLIHDKKNRKLDTTPKESNLQKLKSLTSKGKDEAAPHSDSSDSSTLHKKAKSKGQESTSTPSKVPSSSASSSSSSSVATATSTKGKEDEVGKEEVLGQKDATGSTNLFEKFLLKCEAKDRAPRRQPVHQLTSEKNSSKPPKLVGKIEKIPKSSKDSPTQKPEPKKTEKIKQSDVSKPGQSYGFSLDSDEREGEEPTAKQKPGEELRDRKERPEETQRPSWERRTPTEDRRKRREDSEPRLFIACDDNQDTQETTEGADKSDKGQATLSLGMDLNLDWMTLEDFQKHLNGEDEILSGPPLSPSELRDAVKSGDYMAVKLALNSKEDYNLDQEACTIDEAKSFEGERSLIEERSSSALRLTSNLGSAQNEESTPRVQEIVPQDLDGPKDGEKMPRCPASTSTEQVTMREHEKIQRDITESKNTACDPSTKQESQGKQDQKQALEGNVNDNEDMSDNTKGVAQKPALKRRPWSEKEQAAVKRYLHEFITMMKVPGKKECNACIAAEPDLGGRSWTDVKNYVHNTLQTIRRRNNQQHSDGNVGESPKTEIHTTKKDLEDPSFVCSMTTVHPDHLTESSNCCMTMVPPTSLRESSTPFPQDMTATYATLCSASTNMVHSQPLISTFTPLNATDTQVVPTFTPHNTTNALMPPSYTSENNIIMPMSPLYTQNTTSMPPPSVYTPQDTTTSPMIPNFSTLNVPSTSLVPTFTPLNTPSSPVVPAFSTLNNRSRPIVSSFTPLNHSGTPPYSTNPPRSSTTAQVVPTIHRPSVPDRTLVVQGSTPTSAAVPPAAKPQKRIKRLWSEEEQAAVRRQFGDLCKLVKVPGKKDCDACLAAEPALNSRTWREVKYFVHNSIQSMKRRGHPVASKQIGGPEPETHNANTEWDGPVYLSL
uniref:M-phase phosphoprotein 8 isoform X2 n=1 Tax=Scatophagus argus TaxID=75038 RepID=UPI001ED82C57|nr:M-phase phosphoprotein 8 isoform X2 [Scatophagus argus]